jgi:hypothetical protein
MAFRDMTWKLWQNQRQISLVPGCKLVCTLGFDEPNKDRLKTLGSSERETRDSRQLFKDVTNSRNCNGNIAGEESDTGSEGMLAVTNLSFSSKIMKM